MSRVWGLLALRFANADLLPLDYSIYASEVASYLQGLEKLAPADFFAGTIRPLMEKCREWQAAAAKVSGQLEVWRAGTEVAAPFRAPNGGLKPAATAADGGLKPAATDAINRALMAQERAWLDEQGIPGRPWFRHLVYAPLASYEAETLPGLREALEAGDLERARQQAERLRDALERARRALTDVVREADQERERLR
jgi:N-acetylated-alpha-linked acidic dipeptidase